MARNPESKKRTQARSSEISAYRLDDQVGFILRQVSQRHAALFSRTMSETTPVQWAILAKLYEVESSSQNSLGRLTAMDIATTKAVVDRLLKRNLIYSRTDDTDARLRLLALTPVGKAFVEASFAAARSISDETLAPLSEAEQLSLLGLLRRLR